MFGRIGAVLRLLGGCNFVDNKALRGFLLSCQYKVLQLLVSNFIFSSFELFFSGWLSWTKFQNSNLTAYIWLSTVWWFQQIPWRVSRSIPHLLWICCFQLVRRIWFEITLFWIRNHWYSCNESLNWRCNVFSVCYACVRWKRLRFWAVTRRCSVL